MDTPITPALASPWLQVEPIRSVLRRLPGGVSDWLSPSERERYAGLRVASRANQFLAGHWLVREGLAARYGGTPLDWPLRERRSLPPRPEREGCTAQVSIAHSGDWIAAAIADEPIGIDLEQRRPRPGLLAFAHLLRAEDDPPELDEDTLLQRWVIKEAWIKRHGFSALPERLAGMAIRSCGPYDAGVRLWSTADIHVGLCQEPAAEYPAVACGNTEDPAPLALSHATRRYWQVRNLAA
jgi:4'-phosphopantetheinyl transferase